MSVEPLVYMMLLLLAMFINIDSDRYSVSVLYLWNKGQKIAVPVHMFCFIMNITQTLATIRLIFTVHVISSWCRASL